jgi:hypothetical protein
MMPTNAVTKIDRLFELLPVSYRQRDIEEGSSLQMLLRVIAEQVNLVEQDIGQLYNNWFIETCQDWVVPYIGDLIGYQPVNPPDPTMDVSAALERVLIPRREVSNTIRYRRRKGTLSLLQDLSVAVSGWPSMVVEFDERVSATQTLSDLRLARGLIDIHDSMALDLIDGPFDRKSHSVEIRAIDSPVSTGRYNSASVGVLVGRLRAYSVTDSLAYCQEEAGDHCYTFSILGNDTPLFTHPIGATAGKSVIPFPIPIRRRAFQHDRTSHGAAALQASTSFYGEEQGLAIWAEGWSDCDPKLAIPYSRIIPADLTNWQYQPKHNHIAVDPQLGRIAFPPEQLPPGDVRVSYAYGFSAEIGGGEYPRKTILPSSQVRLYEIGAGAEFSTIHSACAKWHEEKPVHAVIEINDSGIYQEQIHIVIPEKHSLELRAASGARPVILMLDWHSSRPDALTVSSEAGSQFTLDGLTVAGRGIQVSGGLKSLTIRHATLVPGWSIHPDNRARKAGQPSLVLHNLTADIEIAHSILGGIQILQESEEVDPIDLRLSNCIIDAVHAHAFAISAPEEAIAPAVLHARNCTIFGKVQMHSILLAENSIFMAEICVARRQQGCMRFCYVPLDSRTPGRFHCQPDLADQTALQQGELQALPAKEAAELRRAEQLRVQPQLLSTRYGTPDYCRLADDCALEIATGADDQSEMGIFHDLYQPQRASNLRTRLHEFTPAGINAGIIFAT